MTSSEFYEKYGDVKVVFDYYYKYAFSYIGNTPEGHIIAVKYGGESDAIYRHEVSCGCEESISALMPYEGKVIDINGVTIDSFYDF